LSWPNVHILTQSSQTTLQLLSYEIVSEGPTDLYIFNMSIAANLISNFTINYSSPVNYSNIINNRGAFIEASLIAGLLNFFFL